MDINLHEITIRELVNGFADDNDGGVVGYGGKLDIRPPYQREFIYKGKQKEAVIDTISQNYPLNVMYWAVRDYGGYEIIDGQQRTMSICLYYQGGFAVQFGKIKERRAFHNLQDDEQNKFLDYKLMIYLCEGSPSKKLGWFRTINIAGAKLKEQELRNAVYSGSWVTDAKKYFSKNGCPAHGLASKYLQGEMDRQSYLETAIKWISNDSIESYMIENQHKPEAVELWKYFEKVIEWVKSVFPKYRKEMQGIEWGLFYNQFGKQKFDAAKIETEVAKLMLDEEVGSNKGIYAYILTRNEKHLHIRAFSEIQKRKTYEKQKGICPDCKEHFELKEMEADHIVPWSKGGSTAPENCQMLCKPCNRVKSDK